jgi:exopolyphosphatase/guanosine-5'-triphosphate,3'-diphosphate pyrophosphatase
VSASTSDVVARIPPVRVAVVDVCSNSVRLLIASVKRGTDIRDLGRERVYLRLGDDAYRIGRIGARKLDVLAEVADRYARRARAARVERLETIVTAPGRQATNAEEIVDLLADATSAPVVVLGAEDEGRLAWEGAVARTSLTTEVVAVVDLGGGSCEGALGTLSTGPTWVHSRDAGALRVTRTFLPSARPTARDVAAARDGVRELFQGLDLSPPDVGLAVGGTARALARILGVRFGARKLDALADRFAAEGVCTVTRGLDISPERGSTLLGGTLVLSEVSRRLDTKLTVGRGGLREGVALALARVASAAA